MFGEGCTYSVRSKFPRTCLARWLLHPARTRSALLSCAREVGFFPECFVRIHGEHLGWAADRAIWEFCYENVELAVAVTRQLDETRPVLPRMAVRAASRLPSAFLILNFLRPSLKPMQSACAERDIRRVLATFEAAARFRFTRFYVASPILLPRSACL